MAVLALDLGKRRIGVAASDELGVTAQGLATLDARNRRADLAAIAAIARERNASLIVVGFPLNMNGTEGPQAEWTRDYAQAIERATGLPVKLWDERLTSAEASRLISDSGSRVDRKSGTLDRLSAVLILQSYLDSQS